MHSANPFAAPTAGLPDTTWWSLWSMGSTVAIGPHALDVRTWHWTGLTTAQVDGVEVYRDRNMGWHTEIDLPVGRHLTQIRTRWYPIQPVQLRVDGDVWVDDLFPQIAWLKVLGALATLPFAIAISGNITYNLWGMLLLLRTLPLD